MERPNQRQEHTVDDVTVAAPSTRQSDRLLVKAGIWIFGYDRLLRWFKSSKSLSARTKAALDSGAREVLLQRTNLIAALEERSIEALETYREDNADVRPISDLRVGLLIPSFQMAKGGAEKVAGRLANALVDAGSRVHIFCRPPTAAGPAYAVDPRVRIHNGVEANDADIDQFARHGFDLLVGFGMPGFFARIAAISRLLNVPYVIQECNNPDYIARCLEGTHVCRSNREAYWLRQAVFSQAAAVRLTVPDYVESVEPEIRPFVYAFFNALASSHAASSTPDKKFITVGAMKNETKNGLEAVRAFCAFSQSRPGWSLHLYGENHRRSQMRRLMEQYPNAQVVDHGIENDTSKIYADAHALVIPSFDEGLPNVVVEALSYGVPCIGFSDCSGVKHLIRDGETGLLLDRSHAHALEQALERISDAALRNDFSKNAVRFAQANLQPTTWEENWFTVIRNAANRLDAEGKRTRPLLSEPTHAEASSWKKLLDTYLYFSD